MGSRASRTHPRQHQAVILAAFALAGMALLMLQVAAVDTVRALREIARGVDASFGHDAAVFPDQTH